MYRPIIYRRCLDLSIATRGYTSFLSKKFDDIINEKLRFFEAKKSFTQSLDILLDGEKRQLDILEKLLQLRKQKESSTVSLFPSVIVKHLIDTTSSQDLVSVLCNRLEYGIFLDPYVSCWLLNIFISNNNYKDASRLAVEVADQNIIQNELCNALSLFAIFGYIKNLAETPPNECQQEKEQTSEITKVRVKFIRNFEAKATNENTEKMKLGRALLKICSLNSELDIYKNFLLLGHLLRDHTNEFQKILRISNASLCKDVLELCLTFFNHTMSETNSEIQSALQTALNSTHSEAIITDKLVQYINKCAKEQEPKIISDSQKGLQEWSQHFEDVLKNQMALKKHRTRLENIDTIINDIFVQRQKLWFFEERDSLDIQIFKKKVYYPKKWFGKKKKPKAIDNFYVPPDIIRKHN